MLHNAYKKLVFLWSLQVASAHPHKKELSMLTKLKLEMPRWFLEEIKPGNTKSDFYDTDVQYILERSLHPLSIYTKMEWVSLCAPSCSKNIEKCA